MIPIIHCWLASGIRRIRVVIFKYSFDLHFQLTNVLKLS